MWIRLRLDIGWRDFLAAGRDVLLPRSRSAALNEARSAWGGDSEVLFAHSVRSAFDLLLSALRLPPGSEVLLSAITVPDMVRIVRLHGLVPVPVDTDERGAVDAEALAASVRAASRALVVAPLFGECALTDEVVEVARRHGLLLIEDRAQAFVRPGESGHPESDVVLFSFGPIKTATAVGGAVALVRSPELRAACAARLKEYPVQRRVAFARRLLRFAALQSITSRPVAALVRGCTSLLGLDFDAMANASVRGLSSGPLEPQVRQQPCAAQLRLLARRWKRYDRTRIERRVAMGRRLDGGLGLARREGDSYWIYPVRAKDPAALVAELRAAGFDATARARMCVVPAASAGPHEAGRTAERAERLWRGIVFLPWYPEMTDDALERLLATIRRVDVPEASG